MDQLALEYAISERLQGPTFRHLQPVFSGGNYDMLRRLQEYDPDLFLVYNCRRKKLEVHSLRHRPFTYACDVPNNRLDARLEEVIRRGDIRVRGGKVFQEIDEHNERLEKSMERKRHDDLIGIAEEMHPYFRRLGWEGV
jgi:hypothetical protein